MTQTTVSPARRAETAAQLRRGRILRTVRSILRHLLLALLSAIWLVPILWLLVTSFSTDRGINVRQFFPASYTLRNYVNILFHPDSVAQFPRWFTNTLVVACFNCVISTCFVLMVAYALSCCRFKGRKLIQNLSVSVNLFPGVLAMIAVYFVLKYLNLTNSYAGLIMVYAGSSGLGYLICKGFFDTIPISLREAAKLDGASDARVFFQVVLPMSKPILVYHGSMDRFCDGKNDPEFGRLCRLDSGYRSVQHAAKDPDQQLLCTVLCRRCTGVHSHLHPVCHHAEVLR